MAYERIHPAEYAELQAQIVAIEHEQSLTEVTNLVAREAARTVLDLRVIHRIEYLLRGADKGEKKRLRALKRQALRSHDRLGQINEQFFVTYRQQITSRVYAPAAVRQRLCGYAEPGEHEVWSDPPRYDALDTFIDGILQIPVLPRAQRRPEPEMVYYQPTPARIVLDMVDRLALSAQDVVYDLGSGLGRVVNIVALVSEAKSIGVEFEPAYAAQAECCARELGLARAHFINADAREVSYGDGTVFFLYTPFKGIILQRVVELLCDEAAKRRIRVCTYGPGTLDMVQQEWLVSVDADEPSVDHVAIFESR
ncbi:MAG: hypothetical protein H0X37_06225 [Herpetosiphonaceae bacterium]|nr:hypothetical protein [Herpetosiphonaceae bacterium]